MSAYAPRPERERERARPTKDPSRDAAGPAPGLDPRVGNAAIARYAAGRLQRMDAGGGGGGGGGAVVNWAPPEIDPDDAEEFGAMIGDEPYGGGNEQSAREQFEDAGIDMDAMTPNAFLNFINTHADDPVAMSACYWFVDHTGAIPQAHRHGWSIYIKSCQDRHEEESMSEGGSSGDDDDSDW